MAYLFSGYANKQDGFAQAAKEYGKDIGREVVVDRYGIVNGEDQDFSAQHIFEHALQRIKSGHYHAGLESPPCSTFSRALTGRDGPAPLRDAAGPGRYGKKRLGPPDKERVRLGAFLAVRAAALAECCCEQDVPWLVRESGDAARRS